MDVVLTITRQIIVNNQADLLHIDPSRPNIGRYKNAGVALTKLAHNRIALFLRHLTMHTANSEIRISHLLRQPVDLAARIAEDNRLRDRQSVVEVTQRVEFPLLLLYSDEILLQPFKRQLITLDENSHRIRHELRRHVQHIVRQCCADNHHLRRRRQVPVHVVDLLAEASVEELVGLVQDQHLDVSGAEVAAADHVCHTAWGPGDDVLAVVELADVFADVGAADAGVALYVHVVAECEQDGLDLGR